MRSIVLLFLCILTTVIAVAQQVTQYSRARIYLDEQHTIKQLAATGVAVDHGEHRQGSSYTSDFSVQELAAAQNAGFRVEVLIPDVVRFYQEQNLKNPSLKTTSVSCDAPAVPTPAHFALGNYGGFFTYTELLAILDSMHTLYPSLISARQPVGTFQTHEGRSIYWIRVSNNPAQDQPLKPQILYTALHHAREPGSISQMVFYLWHLLENYNTDAKIKAIIDNAELYFIPCVNPDGYVFNITNSPLGGGMWRKNRRDNGDGTFGVDLNRNYGFFWGFNNSGSSPSTWSDVYRGPSGFSEPETQAVKWFAEQHNFRLALNYHTFQDDILFPFGHAPNAKPADSVTFYDLAELLTEHNDYRFGTCDEILGYYTNGDSDAWMYGDTSTKNKVFSMTPEVGDVNYGFYPPASRIIPDCGRNLPGNVNAAALLLPYADVKPTHPRVLTQATGYLHFSLQRLGFGDSSFTVSVIPLDNWMTVPGASKFYNGLQQLEQVSDSFFYTLNLNTPNHQEIRYVLRTFNGYYNEDDTVSFYFGLHHSTTAPSTNNMNDWVASGWALSTEHVSPPYSIRSSFDGVSNYVDAATHTITTANPVDLTHSLEAFLYFKAKWNVETHHDLVSVLASPAGTGQWQNLCGRRSRLDESAMIPVWEGMHHQWIEEEIDLNDFLGQPIDLRIELLSDPFVNYSGFYFDDLHIITVEDTTTGVNDQENETALLVYPNPARDQVTVRLLNAQSPQTVTATIYDCLGRPVRTLDIPAEGTIAETGSLASGTYYLRLKDNNGLPLTRKITVLH